MNMHRSVLKIRGRGRVGKTNARAWWTVIVLDRSPIPFHIPLSSMAHLINDKQVRELRHAQCSARSTGPPPMVDCFHARRWYGTTVVLALMSLCSQLPSLPTLYWVYPKHLPGSIHTGTSYSSSRRSGRGHLISCVRV